uniref:UBA domain-containing protein n=1 Tax=Lactuca sativa TaxID=4236 RepID=A0A9R1VXR0_LACSA|nr:hypothetical protein LSAT_V11C400191160 [Lactuca sativa]
MGGGNWDRDTVIRALRVAFNNPEKVVEYLYCVRYTGASRTPASSRSFTTARSAGCPAPASYSCSSKWTKFKTLWISSLSFKHFEPWCRLIPKSCRKGLIQNNFKIIIQSRKVGMLDLTMIGTLGYLKS